MVWIGAVDCLQINKAESLVKEWKLDPAACKFERSPATSSSRLTLVYGKELFSVQADVTAETRSAAGVKMVFSGGFPYP